LTPSGADLGDGTPTDVDAAAGVQPPRDSHAQESTAGFNGSDGATTVPVPVPDPPPMPVASQAEGVKRVADALTAATQARWPMYLRNVKQILRAADGGFDERRYGFSGLVDLVRACQREGLVRLERDRRGGLRVFPGPSLTRPVLPREVAEVRPVPYTETPAPEAPPPPDSGDVDIVDSEPMPTVDPTAELLGTVKRRRTVRPGSERRAAPAGAAKKSAGRKPAPRRTTRAKAAAANKDDAGAE